MKVLFFKKNNITTVNQLTVLIVTSYLLKSPFTFLSEVDLEKKQMI